VTAWWAASSISTVSTKQASGCGDFPVSVRRPRLQSRFWRFGLRRQKSCSKLDLATCVWHEVLEAQSA
jgi:hypothetical protein